MAEHPQQATVQDHSIGNIIIVQYKTYTKRSNHITRTL
ncbi:hypothetical protein SAMD00079811_57670 [Scytonema sp. HK-05]|nr:hypothetical protein SAMD00079811_57670 [Scytonema sp. HK-05]